MSLSLKESTLVLAKIRAHHGNAPITDLEARTFQEELRADATLADAMEAVKRFYAANDQGRWMLSGDVNAGIRAIHKERIPDEAQIDRLMDQAGIYAFDHMFIYRRRLIKAICDGKSLEQAHAIAVEASQRLVIEAPKPKPKTRPVRHFIGHGQTKAGDMNINDVIGGTA